ncbi:MAG: MBL fold metallo-hydrolase [Solirubrobacterales bacterium]|nr:MBL fold metallo-hydrolase [Solirubrobacterales bacterium]
MAEPDPTPESEAALAQAREWGVHTIPVPTPFAVGRINCYLIEGDPLTLIDAGPRSEKSMQGLEAGVEAAGYRLEDIELVVATHQHIDHIGQIASVVERSGAGVASLDLVVDRLASFAWGSEQEDQLAVDLMVRYGVSEDIANLLKEVTASFRELGAPVEVTRPFAAGDSITMGSRVYETFHRPGHSPSDTVFWDEERGLMFGGDHLLSHISSNPLISRSLDGSEERTRSLINYRDSLEKTAAMPVRIMLSGHGLAITDHAELIEKRIAGQDRRTEKIYGLVAEGHSSPHGIANAIWGDIALTQAYLTLSEVIGHLDILLADGRVVENEGEKYSTFEVTS